MVWPTTGRRGSVCLPRHVYVRQAVCHLPQPLSTPLLSVRRTSLTRPLTAACLWEHVVTGCADQTPLCSHQPYPRAYAAACLRVPAWRAESVLEHREECTYRRDPVYLLGRNPCTYRRDPVYLPERPCVPTGEKPCTYWREAVYLLERSRVPTGEKLSSNSLLYTYLSLIDCKEDCTEDHTNTCVCHRVAAHAGGSIR
jgi:hypothetical protein